MEYALTRALLEKIGCRIVKGMVLIEDIMAGVSTADKLLAAAQAALDAASAVRLRRCAPLLTPQGSETSHRTAGGGRCARSAQAGRLDG